MTKGPHRITIVAASQERGEKLSEMLKKSGHSHMQGSLVQDPDAAIALSTQLLPDALLIDLEFDENGSSAHLKRLMERLPNLPIVAVVEAKDMKVALKSIGQGLSAVVVWDHFDDLTLQTGIILGLERKKLEDANKTLRVVNSILRHDLLNNLTIIGGALELYKIKKDEKFINSSLNAVERSVDLIKKMKEVESVVSFKEMKPTQVREVADKVAEKYSGMKMRIDVSGDALVTADEALFSVIDNLANNAIIHSGSEVIHIKIMPESDDCEVEIQLADEGIGIPDEVKPKIWQEGYKYGKAGQSGLGLFIVKKVVERYGGNVWVENNQPKGTVFKVRLKSAHGQ